MNEIKVIGRMDHTKDHTFESSNRVYDSAGISPTVSTCGGGNLQPKILEVEKMNEVMIKQATKSGYIPCEIGGVVDMSYPDSQTRRGRVIDNGRVCPTLTTENIPNILEEWTWEIDGETYLIRIRKLTPRECWRLMGFTDEDFDKAAEKVSNTQLYKQAGNSICVNVLEMVFRSLLGEDV